MLVKTKAIVIATHKYQEKSLIVKCFTRSDGLKSYFVRDAFSKSKVAQKKAYFEALNILEIEANHKNKGSLERFLEVKIAVPYQSIATNIYKKTIVLFLSEVIQNSIQEEEANAPLFNFLEAAMDWFDNTNKIANFHLIVMLEISKHLGFYPAISGMDNRFFELVDGEFIPYQSKSSLTEHETLLFKKLIQLQFNNDQNIFHVLERQILLRILTDYFVIHLDGFKKPKSTDILKEIFS